MSDPKVFPVSRHAVTRAAGVVFLLSIFALSNLVLVTGCGKQASDDLVLATVGETQITKGYYEERLGKLELSKLPKDENGDPMDTSSLEGKLAFLDIIINKEVMALQAARMGYSEEEDVNQAQRAMTEYHAGMAQYKDLFDVPASNITLEELNEYYSNLGEQRDCSFMICNFRDDALEARQKVIDGALWNDVAAEYHDGENPTGDWEMSFQWGRYSDTFENAIFSLEVGEISEPVETVYGYWLIRLNNTKRMPVRPLEEIRDQALNSIRMQKIRLKQNEYLELWHEKYEVELDESALWIVYQGLPENEIMIDPVTDKPTPREELVDLDIPLEEMDRFFYKAQLNGKLQVVTIGDFKVQFDDMNVFQRPKRSEMLGGLRQKIYESIDRQLIVDEARERGYFEHPDVVSEVAPRVEEMIVSKLYQDGITYDQQVTPEQVEEFWAEHQIEYFIPEERSGYQVFCDDEDSAREAMALARDGADWAEILDTFDTVDENQATGGETMVFNETHQNPVKDALFGLMGSGDVSHPFEAQGKWMVVRLETITESHLKDMSEVTEELGQRIRMIRKDQVLTEMIEEWKVDFGVTINESNLNSVRPWDDLIAEQEPEDS
ncbi:MAG: peptidyl-prolyl cis-trans isomerase [bacterium]